MTGEAVASYDFGGGGIGNNAYLVTGGPSSSPSGFLSAPGTGNNAYDATSGGDNASTSGTGVASFDFGGTGVGNNSYSTTMSDIGFVSAGGGVGNNAYDTSSTGGDTTGGDNAFDDGTSTGNNAYVTGTAGVASYDFGGGTETGNNPYGDGTTTFDNFVPTEPTPPTDAPPDPVTGPSDGLTEPAPPPVPVPGPATVARALTDAEKAEIEAIRKAVLEADKTVKSIDDLKASYATKQVDQEAILKLHEANLKTAKDRLMEDTKKLKDAGDKILMTGGELKYTDALAQFYLSNGIVVGAEIAVATSKTLIKNLGQRVAYCVKPSNDVTTQITAMQARSQVIELAAKSGVDSGAPPTFTPIVFTAPDPDWVNKPLPAPMPTPLP